MKVSIFTITTALALGLTSNSATAQCHTTTVFGPTITGAAGGAVFFDLQLAAPTKFARIESSFDPATPLSTLVEVDVYVRAGTHDGYENSLPSTDPWNWMAHGSIVYEGLLLNCIQLDSQFSILPGSYGVAIVATGAGHAYSTGAGTYANGGMTTVHGSATDSPFAAGTLVNPVTWNGRLCSNGVCRDIGTNFCDPAVTNSTGFPAMISAFGSDVAADNDVTVRVSSLPVNATVRVYFSQSTAYFNNPPLATGDLCIGGSFAAFGCPIGMVEPLDVADPCGGVDVPFDLAFMPSSCGPPLAVLAGESWYFQATYFDPSAGGPSPWLLSNAIEILFQ